ncbi:quinolinate synthetase [Ferrithrix thermotolerans DSM 19514]|jgi:quinolinate synthase|uniref:Quinolinate synthase n=2 Tax=Ferrithrix TaxID=643949 RepID=A0A1M4UHQ7_9ACTN|nr:quinolinate synthetase [Ferrithrix thermotolerans DSM 19514]
MDETALLAAEIAELKKHRNAVVLAHSYQVGDVQDIADFVGDSLGLSREAAATDADVIVFAGVNFMAETAAILNPTKTVLIPDPKAGCSLSDTVSARDVLRWRSEHPNGLVVSYVNTTAEVKALSDICVTSANAVKVVESLDRDRDLLFLPDMFLGEYVKQQTGREMDIWLGECHVHAGIGEQELSDRISSFPDAEFLIHPECGCGSSCLYLKPDAKIFSTEGMVNYAQSSSKKEFVVATEVGIIHRLNKKTYGKRFIPVKESAVCQYMKMNTLEKIRDSLRSNTHVVRVDDDIAAKARRAIDAMLAVV